MSLGGYIYRAIATNRDHQSDSELVHWYNQRAEDSENRIKELKLDFGGDTLPCSDFQGKCTVLFDLGFIVQYICINAGLIARGFSAP